MQLRVCLTRALLAVALAAPLAAAGCAESPTAPANYADFSQTDVRVGTGDEAAAGKQLVVHYTGWLYDVLKPDGKGLQFDTSAGTTGFAFVVGVGGVIPGWDLGVPGMKVGGLRRLVIPPSLAYGGIRQGPIPPNATLVFDVELLEVK
jgi:FKBP-type peptidyl-prolyl cis-trans isomerase FkpA